MKKLLTTFVLMIVTVLFVQAQDVKVTWGLGDVDAPGSCSISSDEDVTSLITCNFTRGNQLKITKLLKESNADAGYTAVTYDPPFMAFQPSAKVTSATAEHTITVSVTPANGHKFKPTKVTFDACKVGTDNGGIVVKVKEGNGAEKELESITPLRNKIANGNSTGYSHHELFVNDYNVESAFQLILYVTNVDISKEMALRNITIEGAIDSENWIVGDFLADLTCMAKTGSGEAEKVSLMNLVKDLKNGESARYKTKLFAQPTDFSIAVAEGLEDPQKTLSYENNMLTATVSGKKNGKKGNITFNVVFTVTNRPEKPAAQPLKRGLMALHQSSGNLVSWRARANDDRNLRFRLWRGDTNEQTTEVNGGNVISGKTNYLDAEGTASSYYKLEVLNADGNVIETDVSGKTWDNQTFYIPLTGGAPTDPSGNGATYTPNDASYCDMDGDGEYEIILKWSPSNEKDAASSGVTSNVFFDCYKLNGTRLWRIDMGQNFFASAHTMQFIAWDFDGDGYGEFMVKTAPGTVDGQGNYVLLGDDDPTANLKSSNGKQDHGSEYITVFDGMTGAELATIPYHTDYAAGRSYWGDNNQNRSERYLAAIAWLDGAEGNPSPIFARGYYSGAFVGAYDWDGETLKERWVSSNTTSGKGLWGEGAHWISVGDCDGDGKQDIVYGSAALKSDGSLLYRTGLGHGDALHLGDFDPEHPGLEVFMVHEHSPYGMDLRDAKTGTLLLHETAGSDTGRGYIAHFDAEAEGAYWQYSASSNVFDWNGKTISEGISHGGGGSLNNRIYWTGTLAESHYDKSVLEAFNIESKKFDRIQVNGGNYTIGTLNNGSKYNPCVLGDLLGDWREEIVTWTENNGVYSLIINATNYETPYTVPHLMDDLNYRAQVINQNCCYNQPPHLSYNLRESKKITRKGFEVQSLEGADNGLTPLGKYWDCFYTTYPVIIPEGIMAWKVTAAEGADTVKTESLAAGTVIPANSGIIYNSAQPEVTFVPTAKTADAMASSIVRGSYCDSIMENHTTTSGFYEFRLGDRGLGFYLADGKCIEGGTGFLALTSEGAPLADSYVLGKLETGITEISTDRNKGQEDDAIYNLQGVRLNEKPKNGIYIINNKKYVK